MLLRVLVGVVVLRERDASRIAVARQLDHHLVVALWPVGVARERTEVAVRQALVRLHLEHLALVLVGLALPFAAPSDGLAFLPFGIDAGAEHVLLDRGG